MNLTDEELDAVHSYIYNGVYYGDDSVVYGNEGDLLRAALTKIEAEVLRRERS